LHTLTYVALTVVVLALSVATSSWPAVSAGCVFTTIALSLAASVAAAGTGRDRPGER
jgi:hypothetical protein